MIALLHQPVLLICSSYLQKTLFLAASYKFQDSKNIQKIFQFAKQYLL